MFRLFVLVWLSTCIYQFGYVKERWAVRLSVPQECVKAYLQYLPFERLSREESVGQVFCGGVGCGFQIDPQAKPILRKILTDPSLLPFHATAVKLLALEGDEEDLKWLLAHLQSFQGKRISPLEDRMFRRVLRTIAFMAVRDVAGAERALRRMCQRDYWLELDVASEHEAVGEFHDGLIVAAVEAFAITRRPNLSDVVEEVVRETPHRARRAEIRRALSDRQLKAFAKEYQLTIHPFIPKSSRIRAISNFNLDVDKPLPKVRP